MQRMNQIFKFKHLKLTKTVGVYKALVCFGFSVVLNSSESMWLSKARRIDKWHKSNSYIPFTSEATPRDKVHKHLYPICFPARAETTPNPQDYLVMWWKKYFQDVLFLEGQYV